MPKKKKRKFTHKKKFLSPLYKARGSHNRFFKCPKKLKMLEYFYWREWYNKMDRDCLTKIWWGYA